LYRRCKKLTKLRDLICRSHLFLKFLWRTNRKSRTRS